MQTSGWHKAHAALGIIGFLLLVAGFVTLLFPSLPSSIGNRLHSFVSQSPAASPQNPSLTIPTNATDYSRSALLDFPDEYLRQAIQSIVGKPFRDIRAIDLQGLQILDASRHDIRDLEGIAQCRFLIDLNLSHNGIDDVGSLAHLSYLKHLDLSDNLIRGGAGIEGVSACKSLRTLDLNENNIEDITPLAGLESLTELGLSRNRITDVSPLLDNPGLGSGDRVDLRMNPLDMGASSEARAVIEALEDRGVTVLPSSRDSVVVFAEAGIEAVVRSAVDQPQGHLIAGTLGDVVELSLPAAGIIDLVGIQYLEQLQRLDLGSNKIIGCEQLKDLRHVTELRLEDNRIENISPIVSMASLLSLHLASNAIADIDVDWPARGLVVLDLSNNEINELDALGHLVGLRNLDLSMNHIKDISALRGFQVLRHLDITGNQIADISSLSGLVSLWELELADNLITDISPLMNCISLRNGAYVNLKGNPLDTSTGSETMSQIDRLVGRGVIVDY